MNIKEILGLIEKRKEELFYILSELIKINSENLHSHGNEEKCAGYLYQELGLESDIFLPLDLEDFEKHPDYLSGRNLENRYNVVARWQGIENKDELMLMAHEDMVEIGDVRNWKLSPLPGFSIMSCAFMAFNSTRENGRFTVAADKMLTSLTEKYLNCDTAVPGMLTCGNGNNSYVIYGDYYYFAALAMKVFGFRGCW